MSEPEEQEGEYRLVMPIILAKSNGGPYDDAAVVAGMTCGALDQELTMAAVLHALPRERYLNVPLLEQADLIAMKNGYVLKRGEVDEASGWQMVGFDWA
jgi:hypothetical protein